MASKLNIALEMLALFTFYGSRGERRGSHFGAIHSFKPNDTIATVPTPPSHSAANHNRRRASVRAFCPCGVNDIRSRV